MNTETLRETISNKALLYLTEIEDEAPDSFPASIVDFVLEYAISESHFPSDYSDEQIGTRLSRCASSLAMACIEVYSRTAAEGETAHSENGVSRTYDGAWISSRLHNVLPNYVGLLT